MIEHPDLVFPSETSARFNRLTFPRIYIDDRRGPEPADISQLMRHKFQTSFLIGFRHLHDLASRGDRPVAPTRAINYNAR